MLSLNEDVTVCYAIDVAGFDLETCVWLPESEVLPVQLFQTVDAVISSASDVYDRVQTLWSSGQSAPFSSDEALSLTSWESIDLSPMALDDILPSA